MAKHLEFKHGGQKQFVTLAAHDRSPILIDLVPLILQSWNEVCEKTGMELTAWVVLPDHLHVIIDVNFNSVNLLAHSFKLASGNLFHARQVSGRKTLWETHAWNQELTSMDDMERHIDFVHYNPVKHGLVKAPWDYAHSSFREFVEHGYYFKDWTLDEGNKNAVEAIDETDAG